MTELRDIEESLLDYCDGACRDVNFEGPIWEGVAELLKSLEQAFPEHSAVDANGSQLNEPHWETAPVSARKSTSAHLHYSGGAVILTDLQCFIDCEDDDSPFVELTFFPEDVLRIEDLGREFIEWMNEL